MESRDFSKTRKLVEIPDLTAIQRDSYRDFLQAEVLPTKREPVGLQGILEEAFPLENQAKGIRLEFDAESAPVLGTSSACSFV